MKSWRRSGTNNADQSISRYLAFLAWGVILKKIALCIPLSAAVKRVFPQLKLCLSAQRTSLLQDEIEMLLLLRVSIGRGFDQSSIYIYVYIRSNFFRRDILYLKVNNKNYTRCCINWT